MLAIGNGEKCPWCNSIMTDFKIDGENTTDHFTSKHPDEFIKALFSGENVGV